MSNPLEALFKHFKKTFSVRKNLVGLVAFMAIVGMLTGDFFMRAGGITLGTIDWLNGSGPITPVEAPANDTWQETITITGSIQGVAIINPNKPTNSHPFMVANTSQSMTVTVSWTGGQDLDIYVYDSGGGNAAGSNCATSNNPEQCSVGRVRDYGEWTMDVVAFASARSSSYTAEIVIEHMGQMPDEAGEEGE